MHDLLCSRYSLTFLFSTGISAMIKLRNITKSYRASAFKRTFVLRRIDLDIEEGEFVIIMGPLGRR